MRSLQLAPLLAGALLAIPDDVPVLSAATVDGLAARIAPAGIEPWQEVPWRLDLLAARDEARASGRPLFLWAMNGHPLGCT